MSSPSSPCSDDDDIDAGDTGMLVQTSTDTVRNQPQRKKGMSLMKAQRRGSRGESERLLHSEKLRSQSPAHCHQYRRSPAMGIKRRPSAIRFLLSFFECPTSGETKRRTNGGGQCSQCLTTFLCGVLIGLFCYLIFVLLFVKVYVGDRSFHHGRSSNPDGRPVGRHWNQAGNVTQTNDANNNVTSSVQNTTQAAPTATTNATPTTTVKPSASTEAPVITSTKSSPTATTAASPLPDTTTASQLVSQGNTTIAPTASVTTQTPQTTSSTSMPPIDVDKYKI